jgi:membrane protease YdiL (CAAX protease family)
VRDLARRSLRWRVGVRWYLVALLGMPIAVLVGATVLFGPAPLTALANNWQLLFTRVLPILLLQLALFNLAEEIGWTGFLQARLTLVIATGVIVLAAVALVVTTRGRLAYQKSLDVRPAVAARQAAVATRTTPTQTQS